MTKIWLALLAIAIVLGLSSSVTYSSPSQVVGLSSYSPLAGTTFRIKQDFPDPDVLRVGDTYYAYATNSNGINVQWATSKDLKSWLVSPTDALPVLPDWTTPEMAWAPDVTQVAPGHFVLYFTTAFAAHAPPRQCIGVATATNPGGPFTAVDGKPLICPLEEGGAIDADAFTDTDGTHYLVWKNDGNANGTDTWLQLAPVSDDGLTLTGPAKRLIKRTEEWEGSLIEAPTLIKRGDLYVLFYSANDYAGGKYLIGYATAHSVTGPYLKYPKPMLTTETFNGLYIGPGGQDVVVGPNGKDDLVFHSWSLVDAYRSISVLPLTRVPGCGCFYAGVRESWTICC